MKINILEFADLINKDDFIDTIIRFSDKTLFHIDVCTRGKPPNIAKPFFAEESRVFEFKKSGKLAVFSTAWKLSRLLRKWEVTLLHAHHFDQIIIGWLATRLYGKTKLVIGRHYSDSIYRMPDGIKKRIYFWLEKKANLAAERIIVPSKFIKDILVNRQKINEGKVDVIYYALNPDKYILPESKSIDELRVELGLDGKFVISTFARLHEEKGHRYLVEAIDSVREKVKGLRVLFVGEGPERRKLEELIQRYKLQDIILITGWRQDVLNLMQLSDIVVQPTLQEAFSQVMCEAMILGKPLVMSNVSGAVDLIENGKSGMIVDKGNPDKLAEAILKLYDDPILSNEMGKNANDRIKKLLPINEVIKQYEISFLKASNV